MSHTAAVVPVDAPDRLFVEGKELFSLKNYAGCIDKLEAYKQHSTDADLIQEQTIC